MTNNNHISKKLFNGQSLELRKCVFEDGEQCDFVSISFNGTKGNQLQNATISISDLKEFVNQLEG